MDFSGCPSDNSFGPSVQGCRDDFDFTLKFERIFLAILPSAIFIPLSLSRAILLSRKPGIVKGVIYQSVKLTAVALYAALQLSMLVLSSVEPGRLRALFVASTTLNFVAALCIGVLSFLEHSRSPRPSMLLAGFLFLTILFDIAQSRTLWLAAFSYYEITFTRLFTTALAIKAILIALEGRDKKKWLQWHSKEHSPEETSGLYGLAAFLWLNRLFRTGFKKLLTLNDLFPLDRNLAAESLQGVFATRLQNADLEGKHGLAKALAKTLAVPLLLPVAPRIALTGFSFCQPFIIQTLLNYLQQPADTTSRNVSYGLIGATALAYTGIAISTAFYYYFQERAMYMARGCLAGIVYRKTTEAKLSVADDSAAITLMSTDVERIRLGFLFIHEFWANPIEVALACWLLQRQLGAAFAAPIGIVLFCALCTAVTSKFAGTRQKAWMEKIQKRVGLTSNVISNMKHLKISGLTAPVEDAIQGMRVDELKTGGRFRMIQVVSSTVSFLPILVSPVLTFAVASRTLDVTTIFTSVSYLTLLSSPLIMLFQIAPAVMAAFTCLSRIQAFLANEPRTDFRDYGSDPSSEKAPVPASNEKPFAMKIIGGNFGWADSTANLKDINVTIPTSKLTMVVGPVASGKSTLCKALLGETPVFSGQVLMGSPLRSVGYCDQTPFLSNTTIRENVIGFAEFDQNRYNEVIDATMLNPDLVVLPQGDQTKVGSNGITLSGGQKQRVSMARALYVGTDLLIFDDILSGLDADTEEQVFRRVFGPDGLVKKRNATAVLCTHSVRHLPSADHIIALGVEGTLVEEGNFADLVANKKYVHSLGVKASNGEGSSGNNTPPPEIEAAAQISRTHTVESLAPTDVSNQSRQLGDIAVYRHYFKSIGIVPLVAFFMFGTFFGFFYNFSPIWLKIWTGDTTSANPVHSQAFYLGLYALFQFSGLAFFFGNLILGLRELILLSGASLHKDALKTVIQAPLRFFTTTDAGVVTNLFSQDMTLIDGELPMAMINVSLDGSLALGMAAVVATSSPWLAISYPFIFGLLYGLQKFYLRTSRQLRLLDLEAKSPLYTNFIDTIKGVATFRAFGWVQQGIQHNNGLLDNSQRPAYLLAMIQRWLGLMLNAIVAILATVVVALSTQLRSNTGFTGAGLVTLMTFGDIFAHFIQVYTMLETSIGAVSRLKTFSEKTKSESLFGEDVVPPEYWPPRGKIEIKAVSASYTDDKPALDLEGGPRSPRGLALRDLNITIQPGEKVAICGRSGSGKSSTILLLLRLLDPLPSKSSEIIIDSISLHEIDRATLRRRIIAVPQDAVFLPDGTSFKTNLDPFAAASDADCRAVLEAVDLWSFVDSRGGLSAGLAADTLSQGQKQLFSLARAILRRRIRAKDLGLQIEVGVESSGDTALSASEDGRRKASEAPALAQTGRTQQGGILLLDEVSSSVDVDTDRAMQAIIRREFEGYTIVMVSHRLEMVMEFDKVLVMDSGAVVEAGVPRELVTVEGGRFRELWMVGNQG